MYSGIIQERGRIVAIREIEGGREISVECEALSGQLHVDDSVSVDGVCLTVVEVNSAAWRSHAMVETLSKTTLGGLSVGVEVNLELPLTLQSIVGGHLVQGHVDGTAEVTEFIDEPDGSARLRLGLAKGLRRYIVKKGSVALNGVSLTVAEVGDDWFEVALIPHTLAVTNLGEAKSGSLLNLEVDLLAKYVESLVAHG